MPLRSHSHRNSIININVETNICLLDHVTMLKVLNSLMFRYRLLWWMACSVSLSPHNVSSYKSLRRNWTTTALGVRGSVDLRDRSSCGWGFGLQAGHADLWAAFAEDGELRASIYATASQGWVSVLHVNSKVTVHCPAPPLPLHLWLHL